MRKFEKAVEENVFKSILLSERGKNFHYVIPYEAGGAGVPEQKYRDVLKLLHTMTDGDAAYCVMLTDSETPIRICKYCL